MGYTLGVDLGTTYCAAAVARDGQPGPEIVTLGASNPVMPSVVLLRADGEVLNGDLAVRRGADEPTRVAREFKRRLGDPTPLVLGGTPYGADALMGHLLKEIVRQVTEREGSPPDCVVLTHPANYGPYKLEQMREVARLAGLDLTRTLLLTEPEAAAISYASRDRIESGEVVAVYDFGGGTFDSALLRRTAQGFVLIGQPDGMERFGGIDIDAAIVAFVDRSLGGALSGLDASDAAAQAGVARLRDDCRTAKETLSGDTDASIPVSLPGLQTQVRLTRNELEDMLRPRLVETLDSLERVVASAGLTMSDVSRVLLVGGSSRIPLVSEMIRVRTGLPLGVDAHPKFAIALGAAVFGRLHGEAAAGSAAQQPLTGPTLAPPVFAAPPPFDPATPLASGRAGRQRMILVGGVVGLVLVGAVVFLATRRDDPSAADDRGSGIESVTTAARAATPPATDGATSAAPTTETPKPLPTTSTTTESTITEAPTTVAPTTTTVPLPTDRTLSEVADFSGYRYTVGDLSFELPDFSTDALVTMKFKIENVGNFKAPFPTLNIRLAGIDYRATSSEGSSGEPGTTTAHKVVFTIPVEALAEIDTALLFIGDVESNQAVLPLGPAADASSVVHHASAFSPLAIALDYGPSSRYGTGHISVTSVDIGASASLALPAPAGQVWLGVHYEACVDTLDGFLHLVLTLPDATAIGAEYIAEGAPTTGAPIASTCPRVTPAIAYFAVDPSAVSGQTLTVRLGDGDDGGLGSVVGSFPLPVPIVAPNDQVPD